MLYFATAALYLVKQNELSYFNQTALPTNQTDYHQLKAAYAMLAEKSICWLSKAEAVSGKLRNLPLQKYLVNHLRTSSDAAKFRTFLQQTYGPVWTRRVYGF